VFANYCKARGVVVRTVQPSASSLGRSSKFLVSTMAILEYLPQINEKRMQNLVLLIDSSQGTNSQSYWMACPQAVQISYDPLPTDIRPLSTLWLVVRCTETSCSRGRRFSNPTNAVPALLNGDFDPLDRCLAKLYSEFAFSHCWCGDTVEIYYLLARTESMSPAPRSLKTSYRQHQRRLRASAFCRERSRSGRASPPCPSFSVDPRRPTRVYQEPSSSVKYA